ncbi:hypothetical protein EASAB2608_07206 [Streptomyces sp. EAS-AB2608]|nr:hypothetical protein EASAB2608_07206 [Streptomyces sp. EAS-AB2608]
MKRRGSGSGKGALVRDFGRPGVSPAARTTDSIAGSPGRVDRPAAGSVAIRTAPCGGSPAAGTCRV